MKTCSTCERKLPLDEFYFRVSRQQHHSVCKSCQRAQAAAWKQENPERAAEQHLAWQRENMDRCVAATEQWRKKYPERQAKNARRYSLRRLGLTPEQYDAMLAEQQFSCAICKTHQTEFKRRLAVDHCHTTGKVRALLCDNCNKGIGCLKEDAGILSAAIVYLAKHNDQ